MIRGNNESFSGSCEMACCRVHPKQTAQESVEEEMPCHHHTGPATTHLMKCDCGRSSQAGPVVSLPKIIIQSIVALYPPERTRVKIHWQPADQLSGFTLSPFHPPRSASISTQLS
jgi:hypothetical protein